MSSKKNSTRDYLKFLFEDSQDSKLSDAGDATKKTLAPGKEDKLPPAEPREEIKAKLAELVKILKQLGIEDAESRLSLASGEFRLTSDEATHAVDSDILFDFAKITPLIDAGFAVVDAEREEGNVYSIIFICADVFQDQENMGGVSDIEGMEASEPLNKDVKESADELVRQALAEADKKLRRGSKFDTSFIDQEKANERRARTGHASPLDDPARAGERAAKRDNVTAKYAKLTSFETPPDGERFTFDMVIVNKPSDDVLALADKLTPEELTWLDIDVIGSVEVTHPEYKSPDEVYAKIGGKESPLVLWLRQMADIDSEGNPLG
jgi:hypothetical protein